MTDFHDIADRIAADIAAGRLRPGDRLPPQRQFAWRHGIAVSTAGRVYAELGRRGLVAGEVGRGTYVRPAGPAAAPVLAEPAPALVDLQINFSVLPEQAAWLAPGLAALTRGDGFAQAMRPAAAAAAAPARDLASRFLARHGWMPDPDGMVFAGNGRQAIAAVLSALAPAGARIGVEAMTYPLVKAIARRLGITLVPLVLDDEGVVLEAILRAHRAAPLAGLYLQPALHNPLGLTMGAGRRADLAALLGETGLVAVEDAIYGFLADTPPLAALAPERVILVDSLSKRIAPGLSLGFVAAPPAFAEAIATAVRAGAWGAGGMALAAGLGWIADGTADRIAAAKRQDAARRQEIARAALAGLAVRGDARAYHLWLELPDGWRGEAFAAAAARRGIAVAPAGAFAVSPGHAPAAVRLALAAPPPDVLAAALATLRQVALGDPGESDVE